MLLLIAIELIKLILARTVELRVSQKPGYPFSRGLSIQDVKIRKVNMKGLFVDDIKSKASIGP